MCRSKDMCLKLKECEWSEKGVRVFECVWLGRERVGCVARVKCRWKGQRIGRRGV